MKIYGERILEKNGFDENCIIPFSEVKLFYGEKATGLAKDKSDRLILLAEEALKAPLVPTPISEFIDYHQGKRTEDITGFEYRRKNAVTLALAESIERKGRFTKRCLDHLWGMLEELTWAHPASLRDKALGAHPILPPLIIGEKSHNVDLRSAFSASAAALVYYLLKSELDAISFVIGERIKHTVRERLLYPYVKNVFWWDGTGMDKVCNWGTWITSNILFTVTVLEDDEELRKKVVKKAMNTLDCYTYNFSADGGCDEGPNYWSDSADSYLSCLDLLYDLSGGKINVYSEPFLKSLFEFPIKMNICETKCLSFSDTAPSIVYNGDILIRMGELCGSNDLIEFGKFMNTKGNVFNVDYYKPHSNLRDLITEKQYSDTYSISADVWLPDLAIMCARECNDPGRGMYVAMKGGNNGTTHNHNDLGTVLVYYNGDPVLIDMGCGKYFRAASQEQLYQRSTHSGAYHNTADINGLPQAFGGRYATKNETYDPKERTVTMDITDAYPDSANLLSYVRKTSLTDGKVVITDSFTLKDDGEIDIHFLTHKRPEISEGNTIKLAMGRTLIYQAGLIPQIEVFPAYDGVNARWGTDVLYNIHLRAKIKSETFTTIIE